MTTVRSLKGLKDLRLALIGGGKMGEAILAGLLSAGAVDATSIVVADTSADRRGAISDAYGVRCIDDARQAIEAADAIVLAVKPQVLPELVHDIAFGVGSALVVSIAAGITLCRLEEMLPNGSAVIRVMPNTPVIVGEGMSVISRGSCATDEHVEFVTGLFGTVGRCIVMTEDQLDVATAISGSGPAYMAIIIDALARAGVQNGLTRHVAQQLAVQTMRGTARLIDATGMHPAQLIDDVSSPGGVTSAAIETLEESGLRSSLFKAVNAATRRSRELGSWT